MRQNPGQETVTVSKLTLSESNDNQGSIIWTTSDTKYEVLIDKKEFSSGSMKRAYKVSLICNFDSGELTFE